MTTPVIFVTMFILIIMDKIESPEITHVEQRDMLRFMDTLRKTWKITFPLPEEPTGDAQ